LNDDEGEMIGGAPMTRQKNHSTGSAALNPSRRITLACLIVCLFVGLGLERAAASMAQSAQQQSDANKTAEQEKDVRLLELGKPIERELAGGQSHVYQIALAAGQYLNLVVEQRGIDVVVTLLGPDGKKLIEVDSPNGTEGPEPVSWIVETTGQYRLEVRSLEKEAKPGRYEAKLVELRVATARDRDLAEADKLYNESDRLLGKGQFGQAIPLAERALKLREKALGAEHPDTATSLNNLAELYKDKGDYARAEPLYRRALAIYEKMLGAEHPNTAILLNNLALLYRITGDYAQAEPLYHRALAILEKTLGAEHPDTATSLNNLAELYRAKGDYAQAEPLYRRALAIREKTRGAEHPETATSLNNLALLYRAKGDYAQAEPFFRRALTIYEKTRGAEHPLTATSLNNLALIYQAKGDYAQAEPLYRRALTIREKKLGAEHPLTANSLNNLAVLYKDKGDYAQAEPFFRRALTIYEKNFGAEHPDTATLLNTLASLYFAKGDYAQAELLYHRALAFREKTLGAEHPDTETSLHNLAELYRAKGDYAQAEPLFRRALAICEKRLGAEHPKTAIVLNNLASLHEAMGDISQAVGLRSRAQAMEERNLSVNLATGSERQKLAYLRTLAGSSHQSVSLHVRSAPHNSTARDLALTAILRRKGRVLDAMNDNIDSLRRRADPQDRALFDQLKGERARLARLVFGGLQKASPAEYQQAIKRLEESVEKLEAEIGDRSSEFRAQSQPVTLAAVQSVIPVDAALVEFFTYRPFNAKFAKRDEQFGPLRYVAYVLRQQGEARWVELGEARAIDDAVGGLRSALRDSKSADVKRLARRVDKLVMQPLQSLLGETRRVFISPDGALNLVPFAALVDEQNRYLVERYSFTYLTSGRDLLRLRPIAQLAQAPVIVADPDFGARPADRKAASSTGILDLTEAYFPPLAATAEEAKVLKAILPQATVLTKDQATETALKQVASPSVLHIATHGFFLADKPEDAAETERQRKLLQQTGDWSSLGGRLENPLLRSGLGLAGANLRKSGPNQEDDGILTAMEVAGLNLWGTKLVVLSACETGVGEVRTGEGVYGLRRALVLAGAETQVMSLWPVSDRGTRDLMISYYKSLQAGQGRSEAMRQVQLRMLKDPRRKHPFYWASFIVSGEWANLDGKR
jgi:CHAT domain-containing protein/Tfp pilus assembly protein PilF